MEKLKQQFSKDRLITPSSNSVRNYIDSIPVDLLIDILSRFPPKSIARFYCVSRLWESILRCPDFTELYLTKSVARRRLFFALKVNTELLVFSSPQPQIPDENSSLVVEATPYKCFPKTFPTEICTALGGLVFLGTFLSRQPLVIVNPLTGEFITLPKLKTIGTKRFSFGYDPISKKFKVLCVTWSPCGTLPNIHQVLTLETGERLWRTIHDPVIPRYSINYDAICINGVLYSEAYYQGSSKIVCFDFKIEKVSFVNIDGMCNLRLFNCKGKLGVHQYDFESRNEKLVFHVLGDAEKHKWSKSICILPSVVSGKRIVEITCTGEIVFSPSGGSLHPFYIFFYNIERKTYTRVQIKGFKKYADCVHTFLDFVEDMKLI
ncbi:putative F-box protein [Arabidopsis thaliana]